MKYKTIEKYNEELKEMEEHLGKMESYIEKHPESLGTQGNYETYKQIYNFFKEDKSEFINQTNIINLILNGKLIRKGLEMERLSNLSNHFNNTTNIVTILVENDFHTENLLVKGISPDPIRLHMDFRIPQKTMF